MATVLIAGVASVAIAVLVSRGDPGTGPAAGVDPAATGAPLAAPPAPGVAPPGPGVAPPGPGVAPSRPAPDDGVTGAVPPAERTAPGAAAVPPTSAPSGRASGVKPSGAKPAGPKASSSDRPTAAAQAARPATGKQIRIELTGYSFYDNTPAGSAEVSHPILHHTAGGRGTFADPVTVAVPSESSFGPGTRFYLPSVRRYAIVEDSGASSSSGNHLDLWVDGEGGSESAVESCMDRLTGDAPAEVNPPEGRQVIAGPIFDGSCHLPAS